MLKANGILVFDPVNLTRKHNRQADWKKTAYINLDCDIVNYYAWFIKRRYNVILNSPIRGTHVTIINDRLSDMSNYDEVRSIWHGKNVEFEYDTDVRTNGEHWWMRVYSETIGDIRESAGLSRDPFFKLHLSIGYAAPRLNNAGLDLGGSNLEHSEYIYRCIKRFEIE